MRRLSLIIFVNLIYNYAFELNFMANVVCSQIGMHFPKYRSLLMGKELQEILM